MVIRHYPFVFSYRPVYGYVVLLVMLLAMWWETQAHAAIVEGADPEESIRDPDSGEFGFGRGSGGQAPCPKCHRG